MKNKKWVMVAVYVMAFIGIAGYGVYGYQIRSKKITDLEQNQQQIKENMKKIQKDIQSYDEQITVEKEKITDLQTTADNYEKTLSGIDDYIAQIGKVKDQYSEFLQYKPLSLEYNFDKAVTDDNATYNKVTGALAEIFPNFITDTLAACGEKQTNENTDIMVAVNKEAQDQQFYIIQEIENDVRDMNAHIDMYSTFTQAQDIDEQFVNLQVLDQITENVPIDEKLLEEDKNEILGCMKVYYNILKSVYRMYGFVLTDNNENEAYLAKMKTQLANLESILINNSCDLNVDKQSRQCVLEVQRTIKNAVDQIASEAAILPSIPIANQTFSNFRGDHNVARVYHYYKTMEDGRKIVCLFDNNMWNTDGDSCSYIYDLEGEPVYVRVPDGEVYFFDGQVLESDTALDTNTVYEEARWFYENMDGMTNDEYFAHTLNGR